VTAATEVEPSELRAAGHHDGADEQGCEMRPGGGGA
jgi:hypothetical protein